MNRTVKAQKWKSVLLVALAFCLLLSGLASVFAITVPSSTYMVMPSYGTQFNFSSEQVFDSLYREGSGNASYPEYWFLVNGTETYGLQSEDANFTVSTVFEDLTLIYAMLDAGTVHVYCGNLGEPTSYVNTLTTSYNAATNVSSILSLAGSTVNVSWAVPPVPPVSPSVTVTINQPTATSYNTSNILTSLSASGGTVDKVWFNVQNSSGSWVYASNQIYTAPYFMTGFVNDTYTLYAFANNTVGSSDSASVAFTVAIPAVAPVITDPTVSILRPFNMSYVTGTVPVEITYTGTADAVWFNVKNGSTWIYASNYTYSAATSLTGFVNGTYTFYAFAANSAGGYDEASTIFTVGILTSVPLPSVDLDTFWLFLYEGNFFGFLQAYLVSVFLNLETVIALLVMLFLVPLYLRTKSLLLICILWILLGGFFILAVPLASGIAVIFIAFGIGGLLYRLFRGSAYS